MGLFALSLTLALKLETLYLLLPILWIAFRKYKWHVNLYKGLGVLVLLALVLPIAWYAYAYYLEITGAHLFGIFRGHNKSQTLSMLTDPGWYRTMLGRMYRIVGGIIGMLLIIPGLIVGIWERRARLFLVYLLTIGVYFAFVAEGQIDAPYRQLTSIPPLSVFMALGALAVLVMILVVVESMKISVPQWHWRRTVVLIGALALIALVPLCRHNEMRWDGSYPVHPDRWQAAQQIKDFTDANSKLVVAGEYSIHVGGNDLSPVLYHYTGLQGWTLQPENWSFEYIEMLRRRGATHFVAMPPYSNPLINPEAEPISTFLEEIKANYQILYESEGELIVDLQ
jgi:hypothetical protein